MELIHCPDIGMPGLNFPSSQCEARKKMPKMKTCFGGCKAKKRQQLARDYKSFRKDTWRLFATGLCAKQIAEKVGANIATVESYIREYKRQLTASD